jgi:hypothetical protein
MAVDNPDVVDIISIDPSGGVVLTISDHLDWIDSISHQSILQAKINRYLAFVESGEILDRYPKARGRRVVIRVVSQCEPDAEGHGFFERAKDSLAQAGFEFMWRQF